MTNETYSVAALAAALNVPRTTVNDWLARYENFVEAVAVGKRKVYSARTLAVLQEVARLRDMGRSGAEIEAALEQSMGVTPEIAPEKNASPATLAAKDASGQTPADETDGTTQLPAVKKFEENAMELAAFIAELRKEQQLNKKRSNLTAFVLALLIVILIVALGAAVQAVRMQFAERQLEAARMKQALDKLNNDFTAELKSAEELRRQERAAAEKNTALLKDELLKLRQASAIETQQLTAQLAADRKTMQKKLAAQEKTLKNKSDAERKILMAKMQQDARLAQEQLDALKKELAAANKTLQELNKKLNTPPAPPLPSEPSVPSAAAQVPENLPTEKSSGGAK